MWLYVIVAFFCLLIIIHSSIRYTKSGKLIDRIPGPTALPVLGNLWELNVSAEQMWNFIYEHLITYSIVRVWVGTYAMIATADPDNLKVILSCKSNITKAHMYKNFEGFSKKGLITSTGDQWHRRRKILTPAFHTNILTAYIEITNEHAKRIVEYMKSQEEVIVQNLKPLLAKLSLNIICESAMNVNMSDLGTQIVQEYYEALNEILKIVAYRATRPYVTDWIMKFLNIGRKQEHSIKILTEFTDKIIQERKKYLDNTGYKSFSSFVDKMNSTAETENEKQKRLVLLDLLLLAQNDGIIDEQGVHEEVTTFIAAGYDTVAVSLCSAFMLFAENKQEQDKARAEATKILSKTRENLTVKEILQMTYITRCIKESLRILPSVPNIARHVVKEIKLKDYTIPVGQELVCAIFNVHRNPKFWHDPEKFDPDRFLPENIKNQYPFTYLPFSAGPRNCIGQKFAMLELTAIVAHVLYNFYLEPVDKIADQKFKFNVVLTSSQSMRVKFIKINK